MDHNLVASNNATVEKVPVLSEYAALYKNELLNNILPFWLQNSMDENNGGYFTCLDRTGKVYDTDKFMWLQGRRFGVLVLCIIRLHKKQNGLIWHCMVLVLWKSMAGIKMAIGTFRLQQMGNL